MRFLKRLLEVDNTYIRQLALKQLPELENCFLNNAQRGNDNNVYSVVEFMEKIPEITMVRVRVECHL